MQKIIYLIALIFIFFSNITLVFAENFPTQLEPGNNSTASDTSPKLTWEYSGPCPEGNCFKVELDNSEDFSSVDKSTYTNNLYYSPQKLAQGKWFWRVRSQSSPDTWSPIWNFTISDSAPPSPTPTPTSNPTPQPSPSTSDSKQKSPTTNFEIKETPSEINSNQEFTSTISLSFPQNPNTTFYLKGAFKKEGSSNYFGKTKVGSDFIKNNETYSKQISITTDSNGSWSGKITFIPDQEDTGFEGSSNYLFKVARYTDSGSGPSWSNEVTIKINAVEIETPEIIPSQSPTILEENPEISTDSAYLEPEILEEIKIASVAGEATKTPTLSNSKIKETLVEGTKSTNWSFIILGFTTFSSGLTLLVWKYKKS